MTEAARKSETHKVLELHSSELHKISVHLNKFGWEIETSPDNLYIAPAGGFYLESYITEGVHDLNAVFSLQPPSGREIDVKLVLGEMTERCRFTLRSRPERVKLAKRDQQTDRIWMSDLLSAQTRRGIPKSITALFPALCRVVGAVTAAAKKQAPLRIVIDRENATLEVRFVGLDLCAEMFRAIKIASGTFLTSATVNVDDSLLRYVSFVLKLTKPTHGETHDLKRKRE